MNPYDHSISLLRFSFFFLLCPIVFSELSSNQTAIMKILFNQVNSTEFTWDITKSPCTWKGVVCNTENSSITSISLSGFSLFSSNFPSVLCRIDSLESLDLSDNLLSDIPAEFITGCGAIGVLKLLNFSRNRLASLPAFNGFVGLQSLDLSFNSMHGNIDLQLDGLVSLKNLSLSANRFDGLVPTKLGKSMVLEKLELSKNFFQGNIPSEITDYLNLTLIDLSANKLDGHIPDGIGKLSKLEVLILSSNNLRGEIPANLSSIKTLSRFAANLNNFYGTIPIGITKHLKNLDLSYNKLNGSIPSDMLSPTELQTVDLSYNLLEGIIPPGISPSLVRLRLGSNFLNGPIPSTFGTLDKLMYLELDNNSLTGMIPPELSSCQGLLLLNLAMNNLNGPLPGQLGNLSHLEVLKLQHNMLGGEIPVEITKLQRLSLLNISWNSLTGSIPSTISSLKSLMNLNLQRNNLTGLIPGTIGSLDSLLELQLGENQLSGNIGIMPTNLQIALNLSSNILDGPIPKSLSQLTGLEVLDLSNNKLSGEIPTFLTGMTALTQLLLSNNQLSGVVPEFSSRLVFNATGNTNLQYRTNATPPNASQGSAKKGKSVAVAVIIAVAAALFTVVVVTFLAVSISRRYFRVSDEQSQSQSVEEIPLPQVLQGDLLTSNGIHRSNIDFNKAMESVANPSNVVLKTRFSTYYKSIMPSGSSYFVKKINWSDKIFQLGSHDKFRQELEVLGKVNNSNVMTPLAYVLTVENAYLFYEFAPKGTLFDVLHGSLGNALDWASRYSIAVGVAQGLAFLHGCTSGSILLLDLSSKNIMLKSLKEPQVGDIELAKVIDPSKSTGSLSMVAGSVGYIPPEYAYTMRVTMAGNVYSFGVILLELLTGKSAVSEGTELAKWVLSNSVKQDKWDHILDYSVSRTSLAVRNQMLAVLKVALGCVSISPEGRPKMKSVLRMLLNAR